MSLHHHNPSQYYLTRTSSQLCRSSCRPCRGRRTRCSRTCPRRRSNTTTGRQVRHALFSVRPHLITPHPPSHPLQHHAGYVTKLNGMVPGTEWEGKELDDIMLKAPAGGLFNNAAQST